MKKTIFLFFLISVALILPISIFAHQENSTSSDGMMGQMGMMAGWGLWPWFGWIFPISIWVLIIVAIFALIKWTTKK